MGDLVQGAFPDPLDDGVYALEDGTIGHGTPPDLTPKQAEQLRAAVNEMRAVLDEVRDHPDRFVIFTGARFTEHHRRGDVECVQGRCQGKATALPECPLCFAGRIHRPLKAGAAARCDSCDQPVLVPSESEA